MDFLKKIVFIIFVRIIYCVFVRSDDVLSHEQSFFVHILGAQRLSTN
jgi:hypothetical protein